MLCQGEAEGDEELSSSSCGAPAARALTEAGSSEKIVGKAAAPAPNLDHKVIRSRAIAAAWAGVIAMFGRRRSSAKSCARHRGPLIEPSGDDRTHPRVSFGAGSLPLQFLEKNRRRFPRRGGSPARDMQTPCQERPTQQYLSILALSESVIGSRLRARRACARQRERQDIKLMLSIR
jgi:hypothetical protein